MDVGVSVRSWVVAAVASGSLALPFRAEAADACAEDVKQLCSDVRADIGTIEACLRKNEASLSPACRAKRAAGEARFRSIAEEFARACQLDIDRLCGSVKPGEGRLVACLLRQQDDLSRACGDRVARIQDATETVKNYRATCRDEVKQFCPGVPPAAGPVIECLQSHREELSSACSALDSRTAVAAAELVDTIDSLTSEERGREALQILQGIESLAFARSQVLYQVDYFQGQGGKANANRFTFTPQVAFGSRHQFAVQMRVPVLTVHPYAADASSVTGLGGVSTGVAWAFAPGARVSQYVGFGLQWISPSSPPIGSGWALTPGYAVSIGIVNGLSASAQVTWTRSLPSEGFAAVNVVVIDPIVVLALPGRSFVAVDTKLGWDLEHTAFVPLVKGVVGVFVDRRKNLSVSAWYQSSFTREGASQAFTFGVGTALAYYFDW